MNRMTGAIHRCLTTEAEDVPLHWQALLLICVITLTLVFVIYI